jgi:Type IV secretion-system coupling protein DNA-binding domain
MESLLESLSLALAELTGLAPTTSYNAVLVAIALAALVVLGGLVYLAEWLDVPQSFEKAQPPGISPAPVIWGGRWLLHELQKYQFMITGTARSGKSLLLLLYLRSVLSRITPGSGRRLILFDPKNELHPYISELAQVPVYYLLPSDMRSCRWDIARDFNSPAGIIQFCHAVLPDTPGDSNPFFTEAFRELMIGVMISLNITQPGRWDLADVVHILESRDFTAQVLNRTPDSRSRLRFMNNERTWANIEATLETRLNDFRIMAAMWSRARGTFSLVDFVNTEGILILGRDPRYAALLDPLNVLLFTQLFGQLLAQSDAPTGRTHLVIDELTVAAGEAKPLPGFKDICERGASRGVVVAIAFQSYADVKALYQDSGDAILGMLQHQVFLRAGDYPTAEFGMKSFGKTREWVPVHSNTEGPEGNSHTETPHWHEMDVVPFEKFGELKPATPKDGISGYRLSPGRDDARLFHLPGSWVAANLPKRSEDVKPYLERPVSHQYLEPLSFSDLKRLRLSLPDGGAAVPLLPHPPTQPAPAALPTAPPKDDITGKLRRLIGSARSVNDASAT